MKKLLLTSFLFFTVIQAKPCVTDIYFGNGIWSQDETEQILSLDALINIVNLDKSKEGESYIYKLAYNPGSGTTDDIIETYWQLKESGQISEGYFMATYMALSGQYTANAFVDKLIRIVTNYNSEVETMYTVISNESLNLKHNVLFVGHSQGNLFGNKMYTLMNDTQKRKFRMVSVGTVSDHVAGGGKYVNIENDYVVNNIPNSLRGDFDGRGHDFKGVYLNMTQYRHWYDAGSIEAGPQIALDVKNAYDNLSKIICLKYWMTNMHLYTSGEMKIYAYPVWDGRPIYNPEFIGTVQFDPFDSEIEKNSDGDIISICNNSPENVYRWGDIDLFYIGTDNEKLSWKLGAMDSKDLVESRKNIKRTIYLWDREKCIEVSHSGEIYDLTKDLFDEK